MHDIERLEMTKTGKRWLFRMGGVALGAAVVVGVYQLGLISWTLFYVLLTSGAVAVIGAAVWITNKTRVIFRFYVAANEILIDGDKSRYRFEIAEVIRTGEKIVKWMPDAPSLTRFALGALYHSIGDYGAAAGHLSIAAEEEVLKDSTHALPSRQLRRYVRKLRTLQRRPKRAKKIQIAIASLERMHREDAARLLADSQQQLRRLVEAYDTELLDQPRINTDLPMWSWSRPMPKSIPAPPTISDVLNDVYVDKSS